MPLNSSGNKAIQNARHTGLGKQRQLESGRRNFNAPSAETAAPVALVLEVLPCRIPNKSERVGSAKWTGGEGGIRTHGAFRHSAFRVRCDRPLCHLSGAGTRD